MKRRRLLAALGTTSVAFTGCLADVPEDRDDDRQNDAFDDSASPGSAPEGRVAAHFESGPARPECEVESETIESRR